jgi:hypothetical protein
MEILKKETGESGNTVTTDGYWREMAIEADCIHGRLEIIH